MIIEERGFFAERGSHAWSIERDAEGKRSSYGY